MWVNGPEIPWEIYTVLADAPVMRAADDACCASEPVAEAEPVAIGAKPANCC